MSHLPPIAARMARLAAALACLAGLHAAAAAPDATENAITLEKCIVTAKVERDGSADIRTAVKIRVNEGRGIYPAAQQRQSYNRSLETLEIIDAYTLKADGRRVAVAPDQIRDQQEAATVGAAMFQDGRISAIGFPDVDVGDSVVYTTRLRRRTPLYPGQFEFTHLASTVKTDQLRVVFDMPEGMALKADAVGFSATPPASEGGRTRYQFDFVPGPNPRIEAGSVAYADYGRHLFASTFGNYAEMAAAYHARASDKTRVTAEIAAVASRVAGGLKEPRAKAYALSEWVRKNIRYVALYINAGGVEPHHASAVLANRYGDCKDHTVLLEALLAAAGIDSTPALVNLGTAFRLPAVPTTFNHVITYVPALDLYLDSTDPRIAAGYLPDAVIDKPVLLTKSGKLARTPPAQRSSVVSRQVMRIGADGAAAVEYRITYGGSWGELMRHGLGALSKTDADRVFTRDLQRIGQRAQGSVVLSDVAGTPDQLRADFKGSADNVVLLPGPIGLRASSAVTENVGVRVAQLASEKIRTQDFLCYSGNYEEQARYELPPGVTVMAIPAPLVVRTDDLDYSADYVASRGAVTVTRNLRFHHPDAQCKPADLAALRPALDKITRDLKAQIILRAADAGTTQ